jgi:hypothetical protein
MCEATLRHAKSDAENSESGHVLNNKKMYKKVVVGGSLIFKDEIWQSGKPTQTNMLLNGTFHSWIDIDVI